MYLYSIKKIGFVIMNWKYSERIQGPMANYMNLLFIFFMILFNFSISIFNTNIDNYGHIGGLLAGFFLIFLIAKPYENNDNCCCSIQIWCYISIFYMFINYVLGLILLYVVYN